MLFSPQWSSEPVCHGNNTTTNIWSNEIDRNTGPLDFQLLFFHANGEQRTIRSD